MNQQNDVAPAQKPEFEPTQLVDYGEAEKLTRGSHPSSNAGDGNYTS